MYQEYLNQMRQTLPPLSNDQLKELLNNDELLDEKVDGVLQILKVQKESLLTENRDKAESNLSREPTIIELRSRVGALSEECKAKCDLVNEKLTQIKDKSGNVSRESALAILQTAAAEAEEESESIMQKLTDSELTVEAFLESFQSTRKNMHLRRVKAEKMQELMRKPASGPIQPHRSAPSVPPYANMPLPYPVGPMNPLMPMPRPY